MRAHPGWKKWSALLILMALMALSAACAQHAQKLGELKTGMSQKQVVTVLGQPEEVRYIRFKGHESSYKVWEYYMVPDVPVCPEEGAARLVAGMATLGISEVAWSHSKSTPHWVYFLDEKVVYISPAFDCDKDETCRFQK